MTKDTITSTRDALIKDADHLKQDAGQILALRLEKLSSTENNYPLGRAGTNDPGSLVSIWLQAKVPDGRNRVFTPYTD
jgi:hypothetical protein